VPIILQHSDRCSSYFTVPQPPYKNTPILAIEEGEINIGYTERTLGKPTCKWEDNIKMDLRDIGWDDVVCIHVAQDRAGGRILRTRQ
jgi:hypothetical protein